jgi:hypothetical protein
MKQSDRIAKLEKEIDFLKDHITNLHRTFVALVGGNRMQLHQDTEEPVVVVKNEPKTGESHQAPLAQQVAATGHANPTIRRRGAL